MASEVVDKMATWEAEVGVMCAETFNMVHKGVIASRLAISRQFPGHGQGTKERHYFHFFPRQRGA